MFKQKNIFKTITVSGLTVLLAVVIIYGIVKASGYGSLTPNVSTSTPTGYTLEDIYNRLNTNVPATAGNHTLTAGATSTDAFHTLVDVYNKIPSINAGNLLASTTYLGVTGSIQTQILSAANATVNAGYYVATTLSTVDSDLSTGNILKNVNIFGVVGTVIQALGNAKASDVLATKTFSSSTAANVTGTMPNIGQQKINPGTASTTIIAGYHNGLGYCNGDANLVGTNIKNGVSIFGVPGSYSGGAGTFTYGSSSPAGVLTSPATPATGGTYNANNLSALTVKFGTTFGVGLTGTYNGYPGTGWTGGTPITQAACDAQHPTWSWFEDGNGDGDYTDPEDGVCVRVSQTGDNGTWNGGYMVATTSVTGLTATGGTTNTIILTGSNWATNLYANMTVKISAGAAINCWGIVKSNTSDTITVYGSWLSSAFASNCGTPDGTSVFAIRNELASNDNTWIGDWSCAGSWPTGYVVYGSFPTAARVGAKAVALATADCYDGVRDLLPTEISRAVKTGTATAASSTGISDLSLTLNTNGWVGQKVLITGGTGSGAYGRIESNTVTRINVQSWTGGTPDVGSTFVIVYLIPFATENANTQITGGSQNPLNGNNGPLTPEVIKNWKGTRLPTMKDMYGVCGYKTGSGGYQNTTGAYTADKTYGTYGSQVGRTDEYIDLSQNSGTSLFLANQLSYSNAQIYGGYACSYTSSGAVSGNYYGFLVFFRP